MGSGHNVNYSLIFSSLFLPAVGAVCETCHDFCEGCAGGDACPWKTTVAANVAAITAGAMTLGAALNLKNLMPDNLLMAFPRQALDALLATAKMPLRGVPVTMDKDTITFNELKQYWAAGRVSRSEVATGSSMIVDRVMEGSPEAHEIKRLEFDLKSLELALKDEPRTDDMGGYRYYILARISHHVMRTSGAWVKGVADRVSAAASSASSLVSALQFPDASCADVVVPVMLHYYQVFTHALGFDNILGVSHFLSRVAYDAVLKLGYNWLFAMELLVVYIKALDASSVLTITSIWDAGSQDTYLTAAKADFRQRWGEKAMFFRTRGGTPLATQRDEDGLDVPGAFASKRPYNGKGSRSPTAKLCVYYNTGVDHPPSALHPDGTCKRAHLCDCFVTDKGPGGQCRSKKHTRLECDNPNKGPKQE